jgi:hypothetical protein
VAQAEIRTIVIEKPDVLEQKSEGNLPIWPVGSETRVFGNTYKMKTLSGDDVYVLVPAIEDGAVRDNLGTDAYKYFDCHSYALGLWNTNTNSGYVFMPAYYSAPDKSAFMKTIEDTKLFHTIREPLETIPQDGTKIISGDIITFGTRMRLPILSRLTEPPNIRVGYAMIQQRSSPRMVPKNSTRGLRLSGG